MNIVTPTRIGPYNILYKIASGSFSTVYQGCDTRDNRSVAMKFVNRKDLSDNNLWSFFERELRIAQRVDHPSIAKIYDTLYLDDCIILIMENLRCGTLTSFKSYSLVRYACLKHLIDP